MKDLLMSRWNNFIEYVKNNQIQCEHNISEQPTKVVRITPETLYRLAKKTNTLDELKFLLKCDSNGCYIDFHFVKKDENWFFYEQFNYHMDEHNSNNFKLPREFIVHNMEFIYFANWIFDWLTYNEFEQLKDSTKEVQSLVEQFVINKDEESFENAFVGFLLMHDF